MKKLVFVLASMACLYALGIGVYSPWRHFRMHHHYMHVNHFRMRVNRHHQQHVPVNKPVATTPVVVQQPVVIRPVATNSVITTQQPIII